MYLSITFPEDLKRELDQEAEREHIARSALIQKAVRVYLQLKRHKKEQNLLREGYEEMYGTLKEMQKDFDKLDRDSLKHVD